MTTSLLILDIDATEAAEKWGYDSPQYADALALIDAEIERQAIADDGWSEAEIRSMNGESL